MLYSGIDDPPAFNGLIRSEDCFRTAHLSQRAASSQSRSDQWNRRMAVDADPWGEVNGIAACLLKSVFPAMSPEAQGLFIRRSVRQYPARF
jgi:hypothetical protein